MYDVLPRLLLLLLLLLLLVVCLNTTGRSYNSHENIHRILPINVASSKAMQDKDISREPADS